MLTYRESSVIFDAMNILGLSMISRLPKSGYLFKWMGILLEMRRVRWILYPRVLVTVMRWMRD